MRKYLPLLFLLTFSVFAKADRVWCCTYNACNEETGVCRVWTVCGPQPGCASPVRQSATSLRDPLGVADAGSNVITVTHTLGCSVYLGVHFNCSAATDDGGQIAISFDHNPTFSAGSFNKYDASGKLEFKTTTGFSGTITQTVPQVVQGQASGDPGYKYSFIDVTAPNGLTLVSSWNKRTGTHWAITSGTFTVQ